ncbi:hypothetical protein DUI87_02947 [Hirundo rustica rustica]|uniref:ribonuclease H n=1 Tax=Hirundo rustica rustica TaxID=333673 RepID=A0A3M0L9M9_HIRRU|nr:hypothetical protein DUI87_02947 [Hirundo rustica rustica]
MMFEIVVTNIVNPASFLSGSMGKPVIHDCLETIEATYSNRPDLKDTPLEDAETWFTDGSSYVVSGRRHAGYAVTTSKEIIESGPLPSNTSAQKAEIIALIRALELAKGKEINIYMDSRYAFGVVHAHGAIWKERGLLNSQGKSIKHAQEILRLLDDIQLPERVAIMHIKAHQKVTSELEEGNMLADREAKNAAKVKKPDGTYTMVQDLRIINEIVKARHPTVPDPYTILNQIPSSHQYYSVLDLKDAFWGVRLQKIVNSILPLSGNMRKEGKCFLGMLGLSQACKKDYLALRNSRSKNKYDKILLHPDDAPHFAFSVPTLNREALRKRYHWKFLPQGMKNSPSICHWYLSSLLSPVRAAAGEAIILHYMDDVLVCAPNDDLLSHALDLTLDSLVAAGFELQEEKIQRMPPWKYLGLEIGEKSSDAMKHLIQAFSFLSIPKSIKTDNGPTYTSKEFRSFLQQWGVEHKTGIPYSPPGQAIVERTHQNLKRVLSQQHQSLKLETPQIQLSKALFTLNFLNCTYENLNPPIVRHFRENCQLQLKAKPLVMVKDPATRETEGPHDLITWGRGYACVSTPSGLKWVPAK